MATPTVPTRGPKDGRGMRGVLLCMLLLLPGGVALADGSTGATTTDNWAREHAKEFEELGEKPTAENQTRQLKILHDMENAPCPTAERFLLKLLKSKRTPGDQRLYALRSLLKMVDRKALDDVLRALERAKDATLWQGFGEALADRKSKAVTAWLAEDGLDARSEDEVCACLEALARRPDKDLAPRVAALFVEASAEKGNVDVACRALEVLARAHVDELPKTLLEASRHADARLRLVVAQELPALEPFDAGAEAATRALLQDEAAMVRQAAARAVGTAKRKAVADALVPLLTDPRVLTRDVAARALATISGKALGHDPKAWAAWLAEQDPGTPETLTFPSYHGVAVHSDRVVFLVDASSSMTWPWRKETHRIDVALAELEAVLGQLPPDTLFNVIVFAERPDGWKKEEVEATESNVAAAIKWAKKAMADPDGDTFFFEALDEAFATSPQFDTIFLLTDGNPTAGRYWTVDGLLTSVRAWTRYRPTPIHTIGLSLADEDRGMPNLSEDLGLMEKLLKAIATATHGEYRAVMRVPPPRAP